MDSCASEELLKLGQVYSRESEWFAGNTFFILFRIREILSTMNLRAINIICVRLRPVCVRLRATCVRSAEILLQETDAASL